MKLRTTITGTGLGALLRVIGCGAMTVFASAAISACSGSTPSAATAASSAASSASSVIAGSTPTPNSTINFSANAGATPTGTPATGAPAESPTTQTPSPAQVTAAQPTVAPNTGGGGTAGLQDATLFIIGGAAVVAGAGGIAYHRRATRNR